MFPHVRIVAVEPEAAAQVDEVEAVPAGAAGESFGYRRIFMAGVVLFTLASAACAFSTLSRRSLVVE